MDKIIRNIILFIVVFPVLCILGYYIFIKISFIDETIVNGSGYGFAIGENKFSAYERASEVFAGEKIWFVPFANGKPVKSKEQFVFESKNYKLLEPYDIWVIYFSGDYINYLRLEFSNGKLISMNRLRTYWAL